MDRIVEKLLDPSVSWILIPILAILFWGLTSLVRAMRGHPHEFETWKNELQDLHDRVDKLERREKEQVESDGHFSPRKPG